MFIDYHRGHARFPKHLWLLAHNSRGPEGRSPSQSPSWCGALLLPGTFSLLLHLAPQPQHDWRHLAEVKWSIYQWLKMEDQIKHTPPNQSAHQPPTPINYTPVQPLTSSRFPNRKVTVQSQSREMSKPSRSEALHANLCLVELIQPPRALWATPEAVATPIFLRRVVFEIFRNDWQAKELDEHDSYPLILACFCWMSSQRGLPISERPCCAGDSSFQPPTGSKLSKICKIIWKKISKTRGPKSKSPRWKWPRSTKWPSKPLGPPWPRRPHGRCPRPRCRRLWGRWSSSWRLQTNCLVFELETDWFDTILNHVLCLPSCHVSCFDWCFLTFWWSFWVCWLAARF